MQIDDVLGQAHAVTGNLKDQRGILDNVGSKLENVAARFPMVTGLLNAIRRKKNRVRQCSPAATSSYSTVIHSRPAFRYIVKSHCGEKEAQN